MKEDTYGILITDNINSVISTIKSRSQIVSFGKVSKDEIVNEYINKGVSEEISKVLAIITNDVTEGMSLIEQGYIIDIVELVKDINKSFFDGNNPVLVFNEKGKFLLDISDKFYHQVFLDLLITITNDRLYYLLNKHDEMLFSDSLMEIDNIYDINYNQTFKQIEKIIEYKKRLQYNVNLELCYISLLLEMVKIYD